ncbi:MAG: hypothetical protein IKO55_14610 [Kiritimatiellae bacterium]|nr:hypothetical protein [Kiritimatiellia bacterium]
MTDNVTDKKLATIIEALTALASALSWTQPSDTASASSYLKDAWAAIDKLKEVCDD